MPTDFQLATGNEANIQLSLHIVGYAWVRPVEWSWIQPAIGARSGCGVSAIQAAGPVISRCHPFPFSRLRSASVGCAAFGSCRARASQSHSPAEGRAVGSTLAPRSRLGALLLSLSLHIYIYIYIYSQIKPVWVIIVNHFLFISMCILVKIHSYFSLAKIEHSFLSLVRVTKHSNICLVGSGWSFSTRFLPFGGRTIQKRIKESNRVSYRFRRQDGRRFWIFAK